MPSSYSLSFRMELMATGENTNTWGTKLNSDLGLLEDAIAGAVALNVSGPLTLSSNNGASDQARVAHLVISGSGGQITAPSVKKAYLVDASAATGAISLTTGAGSVATVEAGNTAFVYTPDGANFRLVRDAGLLAQAKAYTDNKVVASSGALPGSSTPRSVVYTDPVSGNAVWKQLAAADVPDAASRKFAIAIAAAL